MGIQVEFNPDLALRNISEYKNGKRQAAECIPELLEEGKEYDFLKNGQRNYWLHGELPLLETKGNQILSKPIASIIFYEVVHFYKDEQVWTKGKYKVVKVLKEGEVYFNGFSKI